MRRVAASPCCPTFTPTVDAHAPDLVVVLGDTVNYGPNPRECVDLVEQHADVVLLGNHEKECAPCRWLKTRA